MTPYSSFLYFGLLAYVIVPVLAARRLGVQPRRLILPATMIMVVVQYGLGPRGFAASPGLDIARIIGFGVIQWMVAMLFLRVRSRRRSPLAFYVAVAATLLPLGLVKFLPVSQSSLIAFVGISYLTFRALDVIFVIQDGLVLALPATEFFGFLLFFPTISAGPIDRYRRFRDDYRKARSREDLLTDLDRAVEHVFRGLLYSFVVARLIDFYWLTPTAHQPGVVGTALYMYGYSMYLFFDFAGYSAFAIGVGSAFGIATPENFNRPFLATNIVDFWNRWHISLSSWLRDHVYGRFVLAATRGRWFKDRYLAGYFGSLLAFGLMGVWHGTAARYLCYGLYHGLLVVGHGILTRRDRATRIELPVAVSRLLTFHSVCFGFLIFSGRLF